MEVRERRTDVVTATNRRFSAEPTWAARTAQGVRGAEGLIAVTNATVARVMHKA